MSDFSRFVRAHTSVGMPPLVPEVRLFLSDDVIALWRAVEAETGQTNTSPPFWAFAWAGGQAVARYVLDHPETVADKTVLDFGAGSGLIAIAAVLAGSKTVAAVDIDPFAAAAMRVNAEANAVAFGILCEDVIGRNFFADRGAVPQGATGASAILIGDMCYERPLAERMMEWLRNLHAQGTEVLIGDPGRNYFFKDGLSRLAEYRVPTPRDLEDRDIRETGVYRLI